MVSTFFEQSRLIELRRLKVLDTPSDDFFDGAVLMASEISGRPCAAIAFVDENRQWFKAKIGFSESETPRTQSVCTYAMMSDSVFEIADLNLDARFKDLPLVKAGARSYAGAPLLSSRGIPLGTLCVFGPEVGTLSESQKDELRSIAKAVMAEIERRYLQDCKSDGVEFAERSLEVSPVASAELIRVAATKSLPLFKADIGLRLGRLVLSEVLCEPDLAHREIAQMLTAVANDDQGQGDVILRTYEHEGVVRFAAHREIGACAYLDIRVNE